MTRAALKAEFERVTGGRLIRLTRQEIEDATGRNAETIRRDEKRELIKRSSARPFYDYGEVEAYFMRLGEIQV